MTRSRTPASCGPAREDYTGPLTNRLPDFGTAFLIFDLNKCSYQAGGPLQRGDHPQRECPLVGPLRHRFGERHRLHPSRGRTQLVEAFRVRPTPGLGPVLPGQPTPIREVLLHVRRRLGGLMRLAGPSRGQLRPEQHAGRRVGRVASQADFQKEVARDELGRLAPRSSFSRCGSLGVALLSLTGTARCRGSRVSPRPVDGNRSPAIRSPRRSARSSTASAGSSMTAVTQEHSAG